MAHLDDERLSRSMAELARSMTADFDLDETLRRITGAAVAIVPGSESADVLLIAGPSRFESLASTSGLPPQLDNLQVSLGEGPCLDAAQETVMTRCNDLRTDTRWPRFAAAAVEAGVLSILSFRLYTQTGHSGALNLFSSQANAFDSDSEHTGEALAAHAAVAILASRKELQFKSALASRDRIGQAKGMLMERFTIGADRAFEMMVKLSQETNTPLAEVAARVIEAGPDRR
ncbi:GAF and ANTAR domain-containing protein [Rhodococcus chondri]|uniref:GAF and ANTAR domain-containing protein n=1 Tax=Rhodococcus chondri TaxID=3065941 RepID=A0ABU7JX65_9NOCA|nr:GAF and ANTAR domain-containing protein [Rhodococcus sp. CC-R104]MEE2034613.1 GAF and ANTAR domain-containing protein [Rhodococcus sp. CC-R104]